MKILHIISSGGMYGAEAVILNLSRTLNESSHSSALAVFSNSPNPNLQLYENAVKEGIESHLIECRGQIDRTVIERIRELVARTGIDIVHAHGYKADVYTYFALRKTRTPFVSTCHNWLKDGPLVSFYGRVDRFVLRNFAAVIAVSDEVRTQLRKSGVRPEKIYLIRNGIDLRPLVGAASPAGSGQQNALTVGWIGRLSNEKGADIFLRAAARVLIDCPNTRFVLIGDGPDLAMLTALTDELKIRQSISFLGRRDDMPAIYALLDVMVSSSRQEGLPMAILEGMASSLPLVATAVGDVPTVVLDGRTGILVPSENVESLATGIIQLLHDSVLRARFGAAGRELIKGEFSAERMAGDYLRVYQEVVVSGKGGEVTLGRSDVPNRKQDAQRGMK